MRMYLSLTPEEVDNALFTCKPHATHGQIILKVSASRFTEILTAVLEFKDREKLVALAVEMPKEEAKT